MDLGELEKYIADLLKRGHTPKVIRSHLVKAGHDKRHINSILDKHKIPNKMNILGGILREPFVLCRRLYEFPMWLLSLVVLIILLVLNFLGYFVASIYFNSLNMTSFLVSSVNQPLLELTSVLMFLIYLLIFFPWVISILITLYFIIILNIMRLGIFISSIFNRIKLKYTHIIKISLCYLVFPLFIIFLTQIINLITLLHLNKISIINTFIVPIIGFGIYIYFIYLHFKQNYTGVTDKQMIILMAIPIFLYLVHLIFILYFTFILPMQLYDFAFYNIMIRGVW